MKNSILLLFLLFQTLNSFTQNLDVPEEILNEMESITLKDTKGKDLELKVIYPENYDSTLAYPLFLGLSGGDQSNDIVNYCYAAWFRNNFFKDYLMILPLSGKKNFRSFDSKDIKNLMETIQSNFKLTDKDYLIAGTSNGGVGAFKFIAESPELYQGAIVMPGILSDDIEIDESWSHLSILLAYGEEDSESWIEQSKASKKRLEKIVKHVETIKMKGVGHVLPLDFDINSIYQTYLDLIK